MASINKRKVSRAQSKLRTRKETDTRLKNAVSKEELLATHKS